LKEKREKTQEAKRQREISQRRIEEFKEKLRE